MDLPKELEDELSPEAARYGLSPQEYILRLCSGSLIQNKPKTGAELIAYWEREGLIGTRPDIKDSQAHARELRRKAERRNRE
jgi:hypothetical protein